MISTLRFILAHPLARKRRVAALVRYGRWQIESRLRAAVSYPWVGESRLIALNGMTGATGNIYCGLHEFADMAFLLHLLSPDDLFIDVGANIGSYTVLASKVCEARVIAIEPDPDTMGHLKTNIDANGMSARVELVQAAVGARDGIVRFTHGLDTVNHVASADDASAREVPLRRLDGIVGSQRACLMKMDVEGYEKDVIGGAHAILKQPSLLAVISESSCADVCGPLEANGFRRVTYEPFSRTLSAVGQDAPLHQQNALFIRDIEVVRRRVSASPRRRIVGVDL